MKKQPTPTLEIVPSSPLLPSVPSDDATTGQQLTQQYQRAVGGMREVLIFGAMLKKVEQSLPMSTRGHGNINNLHNSGGGLKGWLATNAPEISRPTALRFLGVTEAIARDYQAIVGEQVASAYDLPALVLANTDDLDAATALKQGELFAFVSGTSQRSWLDRYKLNDAPTNPVPKPKLTLEEKAAQDREQFSLVSKQTVCSLKFLVEDKIYVHLNDANLDMLILWAEESLAALKTWQATPKRERANQALAKLKR